MTDPKLRLPGVKALLLDLDGVVVLRDALLPGALESLARLDEASVPYVIATNMSIVSRATLVRELARGGLSVPEDRIMTASSAAAAYVRRRFGGRPMYVLGAADAMSEFTGLRLLSHDEAAEPDAIAAAVVVGDAADGFTPRNIQSAFTLLRAGAAFVAMHKNRWWITPRGILIDSGAYVAALEYATERRAIVTGKPARTFFAEGVRLLNEIAAESGGAHDLAAHQVAMVGDDLWNDIRGAQKAGLVGVFVRSGKHGSAELARLSSQPDAVADSIVEVVDAILG